MIFSYSPTDTARDPKKEKKEKEKGEKKKGNNPPYGNEPLQASPAETPSEDQARIKFLQSLDCGWQEVFSYRK